MTSMITARVDSDKRKLAEEVFSEVGLTTSAAVNLFICAVAMTGGIPFPVGIPAKQQPAPIRSRTPAASLRLGLADGKFALPDDFDAAFDALDADVAALFNGSAA